MRAVAFCKRLFDNIMRGLRLCEILSNSKEMRRNSLYCNINLVKNHSDYIHEIASSSLTKLKNISNLKYGYCYYFSLLVFYIGVSLNLECDFYIGIKKSIDFNVCKGERIGHAWTVISGQILDETNLLFWNSMSLYHSEGMKCDELY
jgi:hypothetical protein